MLAALIKFDCSTLLKQELDMYSRTTILATKQFYYGSEKPCNLHDASNISDANQSSKTAQESTETWEFYFLKSYTKNFFWEKSISMNCRNVNCAKHLCTPSASLGISNKSSFQFKTGIQLKCINNKVKCISGAMTLILEVFWTPVEVQRESSRFPFSLEDLLPDQNEKKSAFPTQLKFIT